MTALFIDDEARRLKEGDTIHLTPAVVVRDGLDYDDEVYVEGAAGRRFYVHASNITRIEKAKRPPVVGDHLICALGGRYVIRYIDDNVALLLDQNGSPLATRRNGFFKELELVD